MTQRTFGISCVAAAFVFLGTNAGLSAAMAAPPNPADATDDGVQILTRGPIHEAFAETVTFNPVAGIVAPKAPPAAIDELPPDQKPAGDNVVWIPGYWAWDDERTDFLWVSGTWRALPPGRQWVPGYWGQSAQGSQWTSGYWADAQATEVEYLPEPPQSVEAGPSSEATAADQSWIPGNWAWDQNRYAWRPGYWAAVQPDWTWIPAHYVWTPRGYLFVDGYWDYSVARRGALFAPVYFAAGVSARPGFSYSPTLLINPGIFANQLFLRPRYQHYYFGDYYAARYATAGFYPWFSYNSSRRGYDPFYAHQRYQHRQNRQWEQGLQTEFQRRREHEDARPPHTWAAQRALTAREANSKQKSFIAASPIAQEAQNKESPLRFQPVDKSERQRLAKDGQAMQTFRQERQKLEGNRTAAPGEKVTRPAQPVRVKQPASPIVAKSTQQPGKDQIPPRRHEVLKPQPVVDPAPPKVNRAPSVDRAEPKPQSERPAPKADADRLDPKPRVERPAPPSRVDPPQAKPEVERPVPQPKVERPAPKPTVDRPDPKPRVERPAPQPRAERPQPSPAKEPKRETPQREPKGSSGNDSKEKPKQRGSL